MFEASATDSTPTGEATSDDAQPPVEPLRVLIPSALGNIGLEFIESTVRRLVIAPIGRVRKKFVPLAKAPESEFLDDALGHLSEYFAGARRRPGLDFELPDDAEIDEFATRVFEETCTIPYGETRTYQKIAAAAKQPKSYRLVRSILMSNPIPILIPCHRVVPRKGGVGTYVGGTKRKEKLLSLESRGLQE